MTARMGQARAISDLTESAWDRQLFRGPKSLAVRLGWVTWHNLFAKGSRPGYPDRTCWRERILWVETKKIGGKLSDHQIETLTSLAKAGAEAYVWYPDDLDEAGRVLANRWVYDMRLPGLYTARDAIWTPRSLWTVNGCRADQAQQMRL